jgi:site-specific DNA-methyltransferase (adenine-specific)
VSATRNAIYFSSKRMDTPTPRETFAAMHAEFDFTIDVCASPENACLPRFWTEREEALLRTWAGERVWMNPPYGRQTSRWMEKAHTEAPHAEVIVALVASRTDTSWWHDYALTADEIRFIRGRLWHDDSLQRWAFPSVFVIWRAAAPSVSAEP